jgi:voltage-gated potassium channel
MNILGRCVAFAVAYRFVTLLASLLLFFVCLPVAEWLHAGRSAESPPVFEIIVFVVVLIIAAASTQRTRTVAIVAALLGVPAVALTVLPGIFNADGWLIAGYLADAAFLGFVMATLLWFIFTTTRVNTDTICAALCVYLLMSILWAVGYSLGAMLDPLSFVGKAESINLRIGRGGTGTVLYFSICTLTTLGYGDIVPTSAFTRMLAGLEAIMGQMYLAVLVARLVGMHGVKLRDEDAP